MCPPDFYDSDELALASILDLTSKQTLFELAIEEQELIGHAGAKLIADLRERATEADYTHMYFRDPIRPGIVWFAMIDNGSVFSMPTRGRLDFCRKVTESAFPGFLASLDDSDEQKILSQIPPLQQDRNISGLDLATALEYLVFVYPGMVRAWAALIFTYDHILNLKDGADSARTACITGCPNAQVAFYLMGDPEDELLDPEF